MPRARTPRTCDPQVVDVLAGSAALQPLENLIEPQQLEQVQAPAVDPAAARPLPDSALTTEQLRIRHLEDQLARERGRKDAEPANEPVVDSGSSLVVHFCEDGFTAMGKVWYRGEQRVFDAQAYRDTCDRTGASWLDLVDDEQQQIARWGKVMFRRGPWPGKSLAEAADDLTWEPLKPVNGSSVAPTREELLAAAKTAEAAARTAPRMPTR